MIALSQSHLARPHLDSGGRQYFLSPDVPLQYFVTQQYLVHRAGGIVCECVCVCEHVWAQGHFLDF